MVYPTKGETGRNAQPIKSELEKQDKQISGRMYTGKNGSAGIKRGTGRRNERVQRDEWERGTNCSIPPCPPLSPFFADRGRRHGAPSPWQRRPPTIVSEIPSSPPSALPLEHKTSEPIPPSVRNPSWLARREGQGDNILPDNKQLPDCCY